MSTLEALLLAAALLAAVGGSQPGPGMAGVAEVEICDLPPER